MTDLICVWLVAGVLGVFILDKTNTAQKGKVLSFSESVFYSIWATMLGPFTLMGSLWLLIVYFWDRDKL